jgi:hypothetical protein
MDENDILVAIALASKESADAALTYLIERTSFDPENHIHSKAYAEAKIEAKRWMRGE